MNKFVELLAPAGDLEKAMMAIDFGANAIYLGGKKYSLRARANNFEINELRLAIKYAHEHNAKAYLVTNILCHNGMVRDFKPYLDQLMVFRPDGFICADPYIMQTIHKSYPHVPIHVSTQQSVCNSKAALWWHKAVGATRIVTAREVDFKNLSSMAKTLKGIMEVEYFIHGALCVGYSGHCMMSNNFSLRDANVGGCAQSCRWNWELKDQDGKLISKKFTMSTKDICHVNHLAKLIEAGIASFKVEGRMKSLHYIATIINNYSHALKDYYGKKLNPDRIKMYEDDLNKAANRETSYAWFDGNPTQKQMLYRESDKPLSQNFAFIVNEKVEDGYIVTSKNFFTCNDTFEVFGKNHDLITGIKITKLFDMKDQVEVDRVNKPMYKYKIQTNTKLDIGDIGRISK